MKHFTNQNTYEHVCSLHGIGIQINSAVYIKREKFTIFSPEITFLLVQVSLLSFNIELPTLFSLFGDDS